MTRHPVLDQRRLSGTGVLLGASLLAACAGTPDGLSGAERQSVTERLAQSRSSALIDACVIRDEVGRDYVVADASELAGQSTAAGLSAATAAAGIGLQRVLRPFNCGAVSADAAGKLEVAPTIDAPDGSARLPLPAQGANADGAGGQAAHLRLLSLLASTEGQKNNATGTTLALSTTELAALRQALDADLALVARTTGVSVSGGKRAGSALLTGVFSLLASGGTYVYSSSSQSALNHDLSLVDLHSGRLLWRSRRGPTGADPTEAAAYQSDWAHTMLEPLLPATAVGSTTPVAARTKRPAQPPAPAALPPPASTAAPPRAIDNFISDHEVVLLSRPVATAAARTRVPPLTRFTVKSRVDNAGGEWWYVSAGAGQGWLAADPRFQPAD